MADLDFYFPQTPGIKQRLREIATGVFAPVVCPPEDTEQAGDGVTLASNDNTAITSATDTTIIAAPAAGNRLRILYLHAANSGATTTEVMWRDGASGARRFRTSLPQNAAFAHNIKPSFWDLTAATALVLTTTAAGNVWWTVEYRIVPV